MMTADRRPSHPTWRPVEPPVCVRADERCVTITIRAPLDHDATATLAEAIDTAIATGSIAVLALDAEADHPTVGRPLCLGRPTRPPTTPPKVIVTGPGLLLVPTASHPWTIDVAHHRMCRTHDVIDRLLLPPDAWISIRAISISAFDLVAVTTEGHHLATYRRADSAT